MKRIQWLLCASLLGAHAISAQSLATGHTELEIKPFTGSELMVSQTQPFSATVLPLDYSGQSPKSGKTLRVEGSGVRRVYVAPVGAGAYEVQQNYEKAARDTGGRLLSACVQTDPCRTALESRHKAYIQWALQQSTQFKDVDLVKTLNYARGNYNHALFKLSPAGGSAVYMSILTMQGAATSGDSTRGRAVTVLETIQESPLQLDKVSMTSADALSQGLLAEGRVALYGIFFDTGKADIRPDALPQIEEIAKMLRARPGQKVFIVGHTDAQGTLESNLALSQQRADALVDLLTRRHDIAPERMAARGIASLSPVASNETDGGRRQNRRVEVVAR